MKMQAFDIQHIVNQIKRASPPKDKEAHKLLNNLAILLDKNTVKKNSPLEPTLSAATDKLNETFMDLCFIRKEIVKKFGEAYFDLINNALASLKRNSETLSSISRDTDEMIDWDLKTAGGSESHMPGIFSKLQKARSVIEDAIEKNEGEGWDPEGVIESFFGKM